MFPLVGSGGTSLAVASTVKVHLWESKIYMHHKSSDAYLLSFPGDTNQVQLTQNMKEAMCDPYTIDRDIDLSSASAVLEPSEQIADTVHTEDKFQKQQLEAMNSPASPIGPDHPVYQWVEDIEPQADIPAAPKDAEAIPSGREKSVANTDGQTKSENTHWMKHTHLGLHRKSHRDCPDRSIGSGKLESHDERRQERLLSQIYRNWFLRAMQEIRRTGLKSPIL